MFDANCEIAVDAREVNVACVFFSSQPYESGTYNLGAFMSCLQGALVTVLELLD
jgi:hypothetical protein